MKLDEVSADLKNKFGNQVLDIYRKSDRRLYVDVDPDAVVPVCAYVFRELDARFQISSGVDTSREVIEVLHHFAFDEDDFLVVIKASVDKDNPEIDSITPAVPAAEWIEREMWELLGVTFTNHPNLKHLLLVDDWPEGNYPLRRDQ